MVEQRDAVVARLLRLLQDYGGHKATCPRAADEHATCDCGWDNEITAALRIGSGEMILPSGWLQG